jgi:hypothetical protein
MPIIKSVVTNFGINPEYWVIRELRLNYLSRTAKVKFNLYINKAGFIALNKAFNGDQPLRQVKDEFTVTGAQFDALLNLIQNKTTNQMKDTIENRLIISEPQFLGGTQDPNV